MKRNKPLLQIMQVDDWPDWKRFRVACECTDPRHDLDMGIIVEPEPEVHTVNLEFYIRGQSPTWSTGWNRWRAMWQLLTRGKIELEHHVILSTEGAKNVIGAIAGSIEQIEQHLKDKK